MVSISVIIPTRGRHELMPRIMETLCGQEGIEGDDFEVIVVADGLDEPESPSWLFPAQQVVNCRYSRQPHGGPAAARNRGVEMSVGEILLFLGNDTFAAVDLLSRHLTHHKRYPRSACLGYIITADQNDTNLDRFCARGSQFSFPQQAGETDFWHFYTANISLPRSLFEELGGFSEDFPGAGWEDAEFGYRLSHRAKIFYDPTAIVEHVHPLNLERFTARQITLGRDVTVLLRHHPELDRFFKIGGYPLRRLLKRVLASQFVGSMLLKLNPQIEKLAYSVFVHYYFRLLRYHFFYRGFLLAAERGQERGQAGP